MRRSRSSIAASRCTHSVSTCTSSTSRPGEALQRLDLQRPSAPAAGARSARSAADCLERRECLAEARVLARTRPVPAPRWSAALPRRHCVRGRWWRAAALLERHLGLGVDRHVDRLGDAAGRDARVGDEHPEPAGSASDSAITITVSRLASGWRSSRPSAPRKATWVAGDPGARSLRLDLRQQRGVGRRWTRRRAPGRRRCGSRAGRIPAAGVRSWVAITTVVPTSWKREGASPRARGRGRGCRSARRRSAPVARRSRRARCRCAAARRPTARSATRSLSSRPTWSSAAHRAVDLAQRSVHGDHQRQRDVVEHRAVHQQPVVTEHHADLAAMRRDRARRQLRGVGAVDRDRAARRPLEQRDQLQHCVLCRRRSGRSGTPSRRARSSARH